MNKAVIGVGSNIDPEKNIEKTRSILKKELSLISESSLIVTKPVGYTDQPDFINGSFLIETKLSFEALTTYLKEVENRLGRIRTANKYGPRTIDLDIVVWNGTIVDDNYFERDYLKNSVHEILSEIK